MKNNKNDLNILYMNVKQQKFPPFPKNENLSDWIGDLIYIDSVLVGLLSSAKDTHRVDKDDIPNLTELEKSLSSIKVNNPDDLIIYHECQNYLNLLKQIRNALL